MDRARPGRPVSIEIAGTGRARVVPISPCASCMEAWKASSCNVGAGDMGSDILTNWMREMWPREYEKRDFQTAADGEMQQFRLDEHGKRRSHRRALDAVERDQQKVESDIGGKRHHIELDAERLLAGHGEQHFARPDRCLAH